MQPIPAMCVPALAWLAWRADALGQRLGWRDVAHGIGPAIAAALRFENSLLLEMLVPLAYAGYAGALALSLQRTGPDLPRAKMGQGDGTRLIWAGIAGAMALSALSDVAIAVSNAVNRLSRQNISRYVNGHRIAAASASLQQGASVTEAMLDAGFLTKSNFNREFRRIAGKTPSDVGSAPIAKD